MQDPLVDMNLEHISSEAIYAEEEYQKEMEQSMAEGSSHRNTTRTSSQHGDQEEEQRRVWLWVDAERTMLTGQGCTDNNEEDSEEDLEEDQEETPSEPFNNNIRD